MFLCQHASEFRERVLFIKLDAIGDVLRSASMLPALPGPAQRFLCRLADQGRIGQTRWHAVRSGEVIELAEPRARAHHDRRLGPRLFAVQ